MLDITMEVQISSYDSVEGTLCHSNIVPATAILDLAKLFLVICNDGIPDGLDVGGSPCTPRPPRVTISRWWGWVEILHSVEGSLLSKDVMDSWSCWLTDVWKLNSKFFNNICVTASSSFSPKICLIKKISLFICKLWSHNRAKHQSGIINYI